MSATKVPESFPPHGDPSDWAELTGEETRCLLGLQKYYTIFESKADMTALELAWADLKREHTRLETYSWFNIGEVA